MTEQRNTDKMPARGETQPGRTNDNPNEDEVYTPPETEQTPRRAGQGRTA